jgi:DNA-binding CsgD family transcriptional regulator/ketosteroid isomerase-like protein
MNLQALGQERDIAEIHDVIDEETAAFMARDFERWSACFVHSPRTREVSYGADRGVLIHKGWDEVAAAMQKIMADNPEPEDKDLGHNEIEVSVNGDLAWAVFNSRCHALPNDPYPLHDSEQVRILERHSGRWRIVYLGFAMLRLRIQARPVIQVDENARVIWATSETLAALSDFEGLTITQGRLHSTDSHFNKALTRAIARAAKLRHIFDSSYNKQPGNTFHFPCILGDAEDGGTMHCTVFARDGSVNVTFNDDELIKGKIKAAQEVFSLSQGQGRLVAEIASGRCLTEVAASLGISINTARTHLSRIYEKTGVSSQHALIRLLMSLNSLPV